MTDISVIVCTKDRPEMLPACLRSIDASLDGLDAELVVVEAGDSGAAIAVQGLRSPVRLLAGARAGKSRQLNDGIRASDGAILVFTDDDCRVDQAWVRAMAAPFADPQVGLAVSNVAGLSAVRGDAPDPLVPGRPPPVTWAYLNGAAMAMRRSATVACGGFDERLGPGAPLHGEEHDLALRLFEAGWTALVADAPPVEHLDWRGDDERLANLMVYSRGAGAFLGAAVRRAPRHWTRLLVRRCRYQLELWRAWRTEGLSFGPRTTATFAYGFARGLLLRPHRFIDPALDASGP
jgi:GT2 family glycosyltransferase